MSLVGKVVNIKKKILKKKNNLKFLEKNAVAKPLVEKVRE